MPSPASKPHSTATEALDVLAHWVRPKTAVTYADADEAIATLRGVIEQLEAAQRALQKIAGLFHAEPETYREIARTGLLEEGRDGASTRT